MPTALREAATLAGNSTRGSHERRSGTGVEDEAEVLRRAYRHVADGVSLRSLVLAPGDEGAVGKGAAFTAIQLREGPLRPMNAGHIVHQGQILYGASWTVPTSLELWEQVRAILLDLAPQDDPRLSGEPFWSGIAH